MAKSLQDILKRRQQEEFVGRDEQLAFFHRNLRWEVDDPRRRFVINVFGQGGVGKTWLLRRFRKIAEEFGAATACTDENEEDVPGVMGHIAEQFKTQEHPLKTFTERYKVYRQRRQEIESDPDAPQGFPAFLGRIVAKGGLRLARRIPVGGVVADFVDEDAFAALGGDFAIYVARKIGNKDEVRLVLEPVEVLTPLFLADLQKVAEERRLALFFDTYERTRDLLDPWLRDLLEGRHGDVPANILLAIAGRDELERNHWAPYEGLLARLPLKPFTQEETRDYLARKGITDERVVEVIVHLSGQLPLLVATLAVESPDDPTKVGDPSGEAVKRFLKWVKYPKQREVALDAALPRYLNRDVLAVLVGQEEADALFAWLRAMPFIEKRGDSWAYHEVVRTQMLRYKRQESPQGWANLHDNLAEYYESLQDGLGLEEETGRKNETWQRYTLEALYHRLCQSPQAQLGTALNGFLAALKAHPSLAEAHRSFSRNWAGTVSDAGEDTQAPSVHQWGQRLVEAVKIYDEPYDQARYQVAADVFTALLKCSEIEGLWHVVALSRRGGIYLLMERQEDALADFSCIIEMNPDDVSAIIRRGVAYFLLGRYEEALTDLDRAIELDPEDAMLIALRARTYLSVERYDEALANLDRALELEPDNLGLLSMRLIACALKGDIAQLATTITALSGQTAELFQQVKDDLTELPSDLVQRVLQLLPPGMKWQADAMQDLIGLIDDTDATQALVETLSIADEKMQYIIERDTDATQAFARLLGDAGKRPTTIMMRPLLALARDDQETTKLEETLADLDRSIELDPEDAWAIAIRGETYAQMGRYEEALSDFNQAITLDETLISYWSSRQGLVLSYLGRYAEAIESYKYRLKENPDDYTLLYNVAVAMARWKGLSNAQAQIDKARASLMALVDTNSRGSALYGLGGLEALAGNTDQALSYLREAIQLNRKAVNWARHDVAWLDLRTDSRFQSLISGPSND